MNKPSAEELLAFLSQYADRLRNVEVNESGFPLHTHFPMALGGVAIIEDNEHRYIASVKAKTGREYCASMPLEPDTVFYAELFCLLANALYEYRNQKLKT